MTFRLLTTLVAALALTPTLACAAKVGPFTVNQTTDATDADLTDHVCDVTPNDLGICTLRAAVMQANATPITAENPVINIYVTPDVEYKLTIAGGAEQQSVTGDLDFNRPIYLGPENKPANGHRAKIVASNIEDRIFHTHAKAKGSVFAYLELSGGSANGSAIFNEADDIYLNRLDIHENNMTAVINTAKNFKLFESWIYGNTSTTSAILFDTDSTALIAASTIGPNDSYYEARIYGNLQLENSTISSHTGEIGLMMYNSSDVNIVSSTIVSDEGVALNLVNGGNLTTVNSIISSAGSNCTITGSIMNMYGIFSDATCKKGGEFDDTNLYSTSARLSRFENWGGPTPTYRPNPTSKAIDRVNLEVACTNNYGIRGADLDQRGYSRMEQRKPGNLPAGSHICDTGAVELEKDVIFFSEMEEI